VAEGVESAEVAAALRVMGCKAAQGWHFSRPLNAASATAWLAEHGVAGVRPTPLPSVRRPPGLPSPRPTAPPAGLPSLSSARWRLR
jgi:hypothetical protein